MQLIEQVASDENIEQAFSWLCLKRKEHSPNNDVWNLRRHWQTVKPNLYGFNFLCCLFLNLVEQRNEIN